MLPPMSVLYLRHTPNGLALVEGPTPDGVIGTGARTSPPFATLRTEHGTAALDNVRASSGGERWTLVVEGALSSTEPDTASAELLAEALRRLMR